MTDSNRDRARDYLYRWDMLTQERLNDLVRELDRVRELGARDALGQVEVLWQRLANEMAKLIGILTGRR